MQIHTPTMVRRGGGRIDPPRVFDMLQYFEKILPSAKSLWSSRQDEVYFMGGNALWRHQQWSPSWILPRIRNQVKTGRNGDFFVLEMKNNTQISTLRDFSHKMYFYCRKKWKKLYFHSKMAWTPPTYDVISLNHGNWPSLDLTQNAREGWTKTYAKHHVLMSYPLGENSEKL